jgi:class 3 adenylate cyclase
MPMLPPAIIAWKVYSPGSWEGLLAMPKKTSIDDVVAWLQAEAMRSRNPADLMTQLADRLGRAGLSLATMTLEVTTLHPLMTGAAFTWHQERPQALETPRFHDPFGSGQESATFSAPAPPPKEQGDSGVVVLAIDFSDDSCHRLTVVAACREGFTDAETDCLQGIAHALARPLEILLLKQMTRTLMTTYLGHRTADRVLSGAIRRGDCDSVHAVLWYSDLRGFTAESQRRSGDAVIALLNSHFERLVAPIKAFGGEVLKFMGDGLLAIFPVDAAGSAERACNQAIKSVRAARAGMASLNGERQGRGDSALEFGVALHIGEVMYGNIGAPDRLDFTVIGPTVNLASRLETLCKPLRCPVLASSAFENASDAALASLGCHRLKDIAGSIEVFTLGEFAALANHDGKPPVSS